MKEMVHYFYNGDLFYLICFQKNPACRAVNDGFNFYNLKRVLKLKRKMLFKYNIG